MLATKTTFYLPNSVRTRMKATATARGKTVTDLLTEGAELVLAKYQGVLDQDELRRRADNARERLRRGLYDGPHVAADVDGLVYGGASRQSRRGRRKAGG